mmetsp:Transcript_2661/g.1877  ORF Transcript_2661/g.1877 Transcript_2661/m.1877 type:complete len:124 (+) Transcript_2661:748-1119(+)
MTVAMYSLIKRFSLQHPFLDSDNRHYSQKFYKYVITRHNVHRLFAPVYSFAWIHTFNLIPTKLTKPSFTFLYICSCALTLVPTPLFDFRYFLIPYILLALECYELPNETPVPPSDTQQLLSKI